MIQTLTGVAVAFAILAVVFALLEWTRPQDRRQPILRRGLTTDLAYWLFTPFATRVATRAAVVAVALPVVWLAYGQIDPEQIAGGFGPAAQLPLWLQAVCIIVLSDFLSYWGHRAFHGRRLWRFHAVHHSPEVLDWLSAVRVHPINDALMRVLSAVPVLALGFAPKAVAGVIPFLTFMAILLHANVDWDWGPMRSVVASPRFHRWHHTSEAEGQDKNFAGLLPLWDILFGTYYMPQDQVPTRFGVNDAGTGDRVPEGIFAQLWYPFSRRR